MCFNPAKVTATGEEILWEGSQNYGKALSGTRWVITANNLETHSGRLSHSVERTPLAWIQAVRLTRTAAERIAGVGDIAIDVLTSQGIVITQVLNNVPSPEAVEALLQRLRVEAAERNQIALATSELGQLKNAIAAYGSTVDLIDAGLYQRRHVLDDAAAYQEALRKIADGRSAMVKAGSAIEGNDRANAQAKSVGKLALRAYNGAVDQLTYKLRPYRLDAALAKLTKERDAINRMLKPFNLALSERYHAESRKEIELTADFVDAKEREKEELRARREEIREAEKVERQLAAERERLAKEREHYARALAAARANGHATAEQIADMETKLAEIDCAESDIERRAANTKAGYVYVISNIGAFGDGIVKIGMTRRLDPTDRVAELGDASVPFRFDIHAIVFSENAVELESRLHRHFAEQRVNRVNQRREFFYANPTEVRDFLMEQRDMLPNGAVLEYEVSPSADEWHQSEQARQQVAA